MTGERLGEGDAGLDLLERDLEIARLNRLSGVSLQQGLERVDDRDAGRHEGTDWTGEVHEITGLTFCFVISIFRGLVSEIGSPWPGPEPLVSVVSELVPSAVAAVLELTVDNCALISGT